MYCECLLPRLRSQFWSDPHLTGHRDLHFVKHLGILTTNVVETTALLSRFPLKYKIIKVCEVQKLFWFVTLRFFFGKRLLYYTDIILCITHILSSS